MAANITVNYGGGVTANVSMQQSISVPNLDSSINLNLPGQIANTMLDGGTGNTYFATDYVNPGYSV